MFVLVSEDMPEKDNSSPRHITTLAADGTTNWINKGHAV